MKLKKTLALAAVGTLCATAAVAQTVGKPTFVYPKFSDSSVAQALSDNGKYALVYGSTTEYVGNSNARLLDVEKGTYTVIKTGKESDSKAVGKYVVADVTDDGNIVVGAFGGSTGEDDYYGKPGYWTASTKAWTELPLPSFASNAWPAAVTPDGHYAVGYAAGAANNDYGSMWRGVLWDLTTNSIVSVDNLPTMTKDYGDFEMFTSISPDARYLVFYGNQSTEPQGYIIDRTTGKSVKFGKDGSNVPDDFLQLEIAPVLSPNGKWAAATIRTTNDDLYPLLYNMETGEYTYYNSNADNDMMVAAVDNDGHIIGCNPSSTPTREWHIMYGNVWYDFSLILSQRYGISYSDFTGFENTGGICGMSTDGRVFCSMVYPFGESYVVTLPETISEACDNIDLLNTFTATPAEGAAFTWMETVELLFTQDIAVAGKKTAAGLYDKDGKLVRNSIGFTVDALNSKKLVVTFRATKMDDGADYTVKIPAGTVTLAKNANSTNKDITLTYRGRGERPVSVIKTFPAANAELARLDNSSNFVTLTYDALVSVTDTASASLVQVTDGEEKTVATLNVAASDSLIGIYPSATQYLYKGSTYKVVLKAGSVTDRSGYKTSANEEYTVSYVGTYERQLSTDDATLFSDNFNNTSQSRATWMLYEGDHNTPVSEMSGMAFDADNTPWNFTLRESSTSDDNFAGSHSMYTPAGQSDDWMVIPQLNIPDAYCTLTFDAQSYKDDKTDKLNIVIWQSDQNINSLSAETIAKMKNDGDINTYTLNIGETEDGADGEWTSYKIDLAKYAGKNIYIGFWNNNEDQSAIFVDNVLVKRNLKYLLSLTNPASVVNKTEQSIAGTLTINSETDTYNSVTLTLKDGEGSVIDTYTRSGLSLTKDSKHEFAFSKPLPLTVGETNTFSVGVQLDSYTDNVSSTIKNLAFEPMKRVVLEENTGITCQNCPLGILAIENLEKLYGEQFIPVSIHGYTGDPYGSGLSGYVSYLGLSAAPTARIQRGSIISSPMAQAENGYVFSNGTDLWQDLVAEALNVPADMELSVSGSTKDESTNQLKVSLTVKAALNLRNQYLNVFVVAMEDGILANQYNNCYNMTDPIFGDWGKDGKYGTAVVQNVPQYDMVRSYYGSFTGSNVGFPQSLKAGEESTVTLDLDYPDQITVPMNGKLVFMLFDGNTGELVNAVKARLADLDPTDISTVDSSDQSDNTIVARYTLDGRQISTPQKGINIVRYANGKTAKVVVK